MKLILTFQTLHLLQQQWKLIFTPLHCLDTRSIIKTNGWLKKYFYAHVLKGSRFSTWSKTEVLGENDFDKVQVILLLASDIILVSAPYLTTIGFFGISRTKGSLVGWHYLNRYTSWSMIAIDLQLHMDIV